MRFERLRLVGFKSFCEPVTVDIEDGLTGVVGPNGCGKSNLLEALRWVMGENRPTAMRGSAMEDVIFAGTSHRRARPWAEVVLEIDNSARRAPASFNIDDKLEISRRVTRDLGSVYRVNGKEVRARDVAMLFADAASGAHSPALIRQGHIAELINAKPQARRRLLEEAAGISGLYQRRHDAELRLRAAQANLDRVEDVIGSLTEQQAGLRKQARAAERYRKLSEQLRQLEAELVWARLMVLDSAYHKAETERAEQAPLLREAMLNSKAAAETVTQLEAELPKLREEVEIASAVLRQEEAELARLAEAEAGAARDVVSLAAQRDSAQSSLSREERLSDEADEWLRKAANEREQLQNAVANDPTRLEKAAHSVVECESNLSRADQHMQEIATTLAGLKAQHDSLKTRLSRAESAAQNTSRAREHSEAAVSKITAELAEAQTAQHNAEQTRITQAEAVDAAQRDAHHMSEAHSKLRAQLDEARAELAANKARLATLEAELKPLQRAYEADRSQAGSGWLTHLDIPAGYEAAFAAALGTAARHGPLRDQASGWCALPDLPDPAWPEGAEPLWAVLDQLPSELTRRVQHAAIMEADQASNAQSKLSAGQCLVSLQGDMWRWDGFVSADGEAQELAAQLVRANRIKTLQAEHHEATAALQDAQTQETQCRKAAIEAEDAMKKSQQKLREAESAYRNAEQAEMAAQRRCAQLEDSHEREAAKAKDITEQHARATAELSELREEEANLPELSTVQEAFTQAQEASARARKALMQAASERDQLQRDAKARSNRLNRLERDTQNWQSRLNETDTRLQDLRAELAKIERHLHEASAKPAALKAARIQRDERKKQSEQRENAARHALSTAERTLSDARRAAAQAEQAESTAREQRAGLEARFEAAKAQLQDALTQLTTPLEELQEAFADAQLGVPAEIEKEIARLSGQREAIGAVNLRAAEDLVTLEAEAEELTRERADLDAAIAKLKHGIAALNKEGRARLIDAFETINVNFSKLFVELFGGGEARLVLVESDDPLEAGLEIMCSPPGKKLSTLTLLSGGEQTLTALSLIFAMFLTNPAPICVLDEVDAPLDDANVTRFCNLLHRMTEITSTRFLIITHHAVTMGRMDRLYGVTMQERGVSQLVSVDLQAAEAMVA